MKAVIVKFLNPVNGSQHVLFSVPNISEYEVFSTIDILGDPSNIVYTFVPKNKIVSLDLPQEILDGWEIKTSKEYFKEFYDGELMMDSPYIDDVGMDGVFKELFDNSTYKKHYID